MINSEIMLMIYGIVASLALGGLALIIFLLNRRSSASVSASEKIETPVTPAAIEKFTPDSKYVEVDGVRIHYVQGGEGSDIVLLHGIGASLFIWRFLFPLLQLRHRVTAIDLPGFGKSSKFANRDYGLDAQTEIVAKALSAIGIEKPLLVGSSMGGAIALWMAKLFPSRFDSVIALAPAVDPRLVPFAAQSFGMAAPIFRRALNRRTMRILIGRIVTRKDLITDEVVDGYLEPFLDEGEGVKAFWGALTLLSDARLPSELKDLRARTLIVYGERDLLVPRRSMDKLMHVIPDAQLVCHTEGGHHIMEDEPEWLAEEIEKFHLGE